MQGTSWLLTIPQHEFVPYLPEGVQFIKGQLERAESGFLHWQICVYFKRAVRLARVRDCFGPIHSELTRSEAADNYVHKEETYVPNTRFELGVKKLKRNNPTDWDSIRQLAITCAWNDIPSDIYIRCYSSLRRIGVDSLSPIFRGIQEVNVYWGISGSGKTHRVFQEAGDTFYIKSSTTKWWDSYKGQENIILDEFTGSMDIVHLLKWLDQYPLTVEIKGGQVVLLSKRWWITSNISPDEWYPLVAEEQRVALRRRLTNVIHFTGKWGGIMKK